MQLLVRFLWVWVANGIALAVAAWLMDGVVVDDFGTLVLAALVFALVNFFVKPILTLLGLPLIVITLGLVLFGINMLMLWLTDLIVGDFDISGFWNYVGATIVVWLVNVLLELVPPFKRR